MAAYASRVILHSRSYPSNRLAKYWFQSYNSIRRCTVVAESDRQEADNETSDNATPQRRRRCPGLSSYNEEFGATSLIDAYLYSGQVEKAWSYFNKFRRLNHDFKIDVYNDILLSLIKLQNRTKIEAFLHSMQGDGVVYDYNTYAILLMDAYYNGLRYENVKEIVDNLTAQGLDYRRTAYECFLSAQEVDIVAEVLEFYDLSHHKRSKSTLDDAPALSNLSDSICRVDHIEKYSKLFEYNDKDIRALVKEQIEREKVGYTKITTVRKAHEPDKWSNEQFDKLLSTWKTELTDAIDCEQRMISSGNRDASKETYRSRYGPFFNILPASLCADIALNTFRNCMISSYGTALNHLCKEIGGNILRLYLIKKKEEHGATEKILDLYPSYVNHILQKNKESTLGSLDYWEKLSEDSNKGPSMAPKLPIWPQSIKTAVGSAIIEIFLRVAKINANMMKEKAESKIIPAFYHVYVFQKQRQVGFIKPHPTIMKLINRTQETEGKMLMETSMLPTLVPSRPWLCHHDGGYVTTPSPIMRYREDCFDQDVLLAKNSRKLRSVYDSINYLGSCPWQINKRVLEKCIECFNGTGSDILDIPSPEPMPMPPYPIDPSIGPQEKRNIIETRRQVAKKQREHHALRMDILYKLSVAKHFENDIFWLPHNMDFRGRVYPIPPHLSHIGSDLARSIMLFAVGRPLGQEGLNWLKIHLVNVHGVKSKASLPDRISFAESLKDEVFDSADNPFTGRKWWQTGEYPWQTLATCMELADVWRSDNPEKFVSYFPVHQDGTCNGLQHYAALGRDTFGAEQVNLVSRDAPQDIYSAVARMVEEYRANDATKNNKVAVWLEGKISRKVVKQTVMTIVYGVTRIGGREQIARQLEKLEGSSSEEEIFTASQYLVRVVFEQLSKMFYSARRIQEWLNDSARQIASAGKLVEWETPLALPVLQPYRVPVYKEQRTRLQRINLLSTTDNTSKPHVSKQKMAFPPNYIHSLDSTHMMLTSLECQAADITFVAVHDSFWTHAATVNELNKICRRQFVKLHKEPLLQDLEKFLRDKYDGLPTTRNNPVKLGKMPDKGSFNLDEVHNSKYFFS